jgi:hypothetical protein
MQIKDLAENDFAGVTLTLAGDIALRWLLFSDLPQIFSPRLCELCVKGIFLFFFLPKNCTIMHFFPKSALNMHYSALFNRFLYHPTPFHETIRLARRPNRRALFSLKMLVALPISFQRFVMQSIAPNEIWNVKKKQSAH